jgi:hypothetical protein
MADAWDHDHRSYVGPGERYDLMGSSQFSLLCALGLREHHRLLDIGCGSLRGGRLFIAYLAPGGYTGLEPNRWLVEEGIDTHLGRDALDLKAPTFVYNDTFDISGHDPFDFIVAQSIASHTGPTTTRSLLEAVRGALAPSGTAAITFIEGQQDSTLVSSRSEWSRTPPPGIKLNDPAWFYPGGVQYRRRTIKRWITQSGLKGIPIAWFHPGQVWWVLAHRQASLPPRLLRLQARGVMLPLPSSWNVPRRLLYSVPHRIAWKARSIITRR